MVTLVPPNPWLYHLPSYAVYSFTKLINIYFSQYLTHLL